MGKFDVNEWKNIRGKLNKNPDRYGIPKRIYGSAVAGSFNIRKLGKIDKRDDDTWQFLADLCRHFDLLSVQEVLADTSGLQHLVDLMGDNFGLVISDTTGAFPDEPGLDERLAYIYNKNVIRMQGVITDVTWDRTKVLQTLAENFPDFAEAFKDVAGKEKVTAKQIGEIKMPTFLAFIRTPFAVEFEMFGHPGAERIPFMAINAHLNFGNFISDREQEFSALLKWMVGKIREEDSQHSQNILLMGDLNLNFDNPKTDLPRIIKEMKALQGKAGDKVNVCTPFLDTHPRSKQLLASEGAPFRTNARINQTFDQIGILSRDERLSDLATDKMGLDPRGPDYGVIDFVNLFAEATENKTQDKITGDARGEFFSRFEHKVSDHMPLWFRIQLPDIPEGKVATDV